jgi:hypothetical protein
VSVVADPGIDNPELNVVQLGQGGINLPSRDMYNASTSVGVCVRVRACACACVCVCMCAIWCVRALRSPLSLLADNSGRPTQGIRGAHQSHACTDRAPRPARGRRINHCL